MYNGKKYTIDDIKLSMKKEDYILISDNYSSTKKLKYICPKGHKESMLSCNWNIGRRCPVCKGIKIGNNKRLDFNVIKKAFKSEGYVLVTNEFEYKNNKTKLKYICPEGHTHNISWTKWQQGKRCRYCYNLNRMGERHPNWKGGISCEPYCYEWSFKEFKEYIKERDGNKCLNPDCWGNIHRLSIHHIDYNKKNCGPENLVTLCASCNSRANKDREWHEAWYSVILQRRYNYQETTNAQ